MTQSDEKLILPNGHNLTMGDIITVPLKRNRKWWEFWKRKYIPTTYEVTSISDENVLVAAPEHKE